jgi:hypothetical protein
VHFTRFVRRGCLSDPINVLKPSAAEAARIRHDDRPSSSFLDQSTTRAAVSVGSTDPVERCHPVGEILRSKAINKIFSFDELKTAAATRS